MVRSGESCLNNWNDLSAVHIYPFHLNYMLNLFFPRYMRTFVLGYEFPVKFNEKLTSPVMTMILLSERLQHHWIFFLYGSTRLFFSFLPFLHYSFFFWLYFQSCETDSTSLFKAYDTIQTTSKAIAKRVTPHTDLTTTTTWNLDPI